MIRRFLIWLWGAKPPPSCRDGGDHQYMPRFDEIIDPRLSAADIKGCILIAYKPEEKRRSVMSKIYVKDICKGCGGVVERLEGLNAMQVIAYASKKIGDSK